MIILDIDGQPILGKFPTHVLTRAPVGSHAHTETGVESGLRTLHHKEVDFISASGVVKIFGIAVFKEDGVEAIEAMYVARAHEENNFACVDFGDC